MVMVEGAPAFVRFRSPLDRRSDRCGETGGIPDLLKNNPNCGDKIRRDLWPRQHVKRYGIRTLFRIEPSRGRRMPYAISGTRGSKMVTVPEAPGKEYENGFGH